MGEKAIQEVNMFLVFIIPFILLFPKIVPKLTAMISKRVFLATAKEADLIKTVVQLKKEMNSISMVDEFAKYAKLQRKLNLITLDLEASAGARRSLQSKLSYYISYALYGIIAIIYFAVLVLYGSATPVFIVPKNWFYPLSYVLSFPTGITGAISIPMWTILSRNALSSLLK